MKRRLAILGSTGSIGTQTLDVVRQHPDLFSIELLTANSNVSLLAAQAREFDANAVVICDENRYEELRDALADTSVKVFAGMQSVCDYVVLPDVDMVVGAMVGFSGLRSVVAALEAGKAVALANKETLVAAGDIVNAVKKAPILPVDSEHSAIFQCLQATNGNRVSKIHLTASGGPFRTWERSAIAKATAADALKHPNWNMGSKVTIDSATMMNKGLELIEAYHLFGVAPENINIVVHPESIVHSMIEFEDKAVLAQMGVPDMREPIEYAICYPSRVPLNHSCLSFAGMTLHFEEPSVEKFPALKIARAAIKTGGNLPCIMNAANEAAVAAFLRGQIGFYDITDIVSRTMEKVSFTARPSLDDIFATNDQALRVAKEMIR